MSEFLSWVTIHLGRLAVYLRSASARLSRDRELRKQIDEVIETGISDFCSALEKLKNSATEPEEV
jgi:hypothetical protein